MSLIQFARIVRQSQSPLVSPSRSMSGEHNAGRPTCVLCNVFTSHRHISSYHVMSPARIRWWWYTNDHHTSMLSEFLTFSYRRSCLDSWKWWKKLFLFVATPVIILGNINAFVLADPNDMEPPPFVAYDHLRIRTKVSYVAKQPKYSPRLQGYIIHPLPLTPNI